MTYDAKAGDDEDIAYLVVREGEPENGKSVWDMTIYRLAHELGVSAHQLSLQLPKYELHETGSQLRRAAKSVSANLVEGYGRRRYQAEYLKFLTYAKASLSETEEHLRYVKDCHPAQQPAADTLLTAADTLGRRFYRFMLLVTANHRK